MSRHRGLPVLCAALLVTGALVSTPATARDGDRDADHPARPIPCADLAKLHLPDTTIRSAQEMPAGPFSFGNPATTCTPDRAAQQLPAFCRVVGVVAPSITFEVWLPLANWNGKFQAYGNHGFAGNIPYADMGPQLVNGYAIAGTDTGHAGSAPLPWMQNQQQVIDYGFRGVHETTVQSKLIVRAFYGQGPKFSYWQGCSTGGKQALTEAQRYPDDYDGIVAGDPNFAQIHNRASYVWDGQVTFANAATRIPTSKLPLIHDAALASCDAKDGIQDGVIDNPLRCDVDPSRLLCKTGQDPNTCLTAQQVGAVAKLYAGPRNPRTGAEIYPGLAPGSELGWAGVMAGPNIFSTADQFFKFMIFDDPNWDFKTFNFDTDLAIADAKVSGIIDAINPDLRPLRKAGTKLLHYHGWGSVVHTAARSVEYYEAVVSFMNRGKDRGEAFSETQEFYRLFMAPGGSGGGGPDQFDPLPALEQWVEKGIPPKRIIASRITNGVVDRTRPLCPYPQTAVYKGSGSTDDAANFVCRSPRRHGHDQDRDDDQDHDD